MTERRKTRFGSSHTGSFVLGGLLVASVVAVDATLLTKTGKTSTLAADPARVENLERLQEVSSSIYADEARLSAIRFGDEDAKDPLEVPTLRLRVDVQRAQAAQLWQDLGALMEIPPPATDASGLVRFPSTAVEKSN